MEVIQELKGNSGCRVFLIEDESHGLVVRKTSGTVDYNERLIKQFFKQNNFIHPEVRSPRIFHSGFKGGLFYFDMEYIRGESFYNFISSHSPSQSLEILASIFSIYKSVNYPEVNGLMSEKIKALKTYNNYEGILNYCANFDWSGVTVSNCHGDLTLENIIIKNNTPYLIDFLDSFVESSFIDISKIFVDLMFGWSWRESNNLPFIKNIIILKELQSSLTAEEREIYKRLIPLQLLRILPYNHDQITEDFLTLRLNHFSKTL
jgi:hypothetical protein